MIEMTALLLSTCFGSTEPPPHSLARSYLDLSAGVHVEPDSGGGFVVSGLRISGTYPKLPSAVTDTFNVTDWSSDMGFQVQITMGGVVVADVRAAMQADNSGVSPDDPGCAAVWDTLASRLSDGVPNVAHTPTYPSTYQIDLWVNDVWRGDYMIPTPVDPTAGGCAVSGPSIVDVSGGETGRDYFLNCSAGGVVSLSLVDGGGSPVTSLSDGAGSLSVRAESGGWPLSVMAVGGVAYPFVLRFSPDMEAPPGTYEYRGAIRASFQ